MKRKMINNIVIWQYLDVKTKENKDFRTNIKLTGISVRLVWHVGIISGGRQEL